MAKYNRCAKCVKKTSECECIKWEIYPIYRHIAVQDDGTKL